MGVCTHCSSTRPGLRLLATFVVIVVVGCGCFILMSTNCDAGSGASCGFLGSPAFLSDMADGSQDESPARDEHVDGLEGGVGDWSPSSPAALSSYGAFDQFSISPLHCSSIAPPLILLTIFSRPADLTRRCTIRQTFGSLAVGRPNSTVSCSTQASGIPMGVRLLFIVGQTDEATQRLVEEEAHLLGDIIQSKAFYDSYGQATRKGLAMIHWSMLHCPSATFTAKADDDCWLNLPLLVSSLRRIGTARPAIYGLFWPSGAPVIRDPHNKWSVSNKDFAARRFPPYVSGILYTFHNALLAPLANAAQHIPYLWHDDVFLTGMAARQAGIRHVALTGYDAKGDSWKRTCSKQSMLAIHYVNDEKMWILWKDTCHAYSVPC